MLKLNTIMIFSEDPKSLAEFYKKVFVKSPDWEMEGYSGFGIGEMNVMIGPHDKVKGKSQKPERIMLNYETTDVKGEFDRIKALGATVIAEPYNPEEDKTGWLATFADLDGNYFQLASPWKGK